MNIELCESHELFGKHIWLNIGILKAKLEVFPTVIYYCKSCGYFKESLLYSKTTLRKLSLGFCDDRSFMSEYAGIIFKHLIDHNLLREFNAYITYEKSFYYLSKQTIALSVG